jgi:hypothetical protein
VLLPRVECRSGWRIRARAILPAEQARAGGWAPDEAWRRAQVGMLRDLRPIRNPRRPTPGQQDASSAAAAAAPHAGAALEQPPSGAGEAPAEAAAAAAAASSSSPPVYSYEPPYPGYRADIVAVLANAAINRRTVQQVRSRPAAPANAPATRAPARCLAA